MRKQPFVIFTAGAALALANVASAGTAPAAAHHGCHTGGHAAAAYTGHVHFSHGAATHAGWSRQQRGHAGHQGWVDFADRHAQWNGHNGNWGVDQEGRDDYARHGMAWNGQTGHQHGFFGPHGAVHGGVQFFGHGGEWHGQGAHLAYGAMHGEERSFSEEHGWSMASGGAWADEGFERHTTVDQFGYLDWPGKSHFVHEEHGQGPQGGPVEGPLPPPPPPGAEGPPPPQPEEGYEIRRF